MFESIKFMGAGLGYRRELFHDMLSLKQKADSIEVITEHYLRGTLEHEAILERLSENYNVLLHGLNLSIGSPRLDAVYLSKVKKMVVQTKVPYYTDHLSITQSAGVNYGHLSPIIYNRMSLDRCIENVHRVQDYLGIPLALENITYGFNIAGGNLSHGDYLSELVEKTGCGILLDITNVFINSHNHQFDAIEYLNSLPLAHVIHIHTSGGNLSASGQYIDSHSYPVPEQVWELLDYVLDKTSVKTVILERDGEFDEPLDTILSDVTRCKEILLKNAFICG